MRNRPGHDQHRSHRDGDGRAELDTDKDTSLIRATNRNVGSYSELRLQGKSQQMMAVHHAIADTVDREFDTFRRVALEADTIIMRNMATKCLAFAIKKRREARDTLLVLVRDRDLTIVSNAVLGIGILRDKETDITPIITLLGSGNEIIRRNAGTAIGQLFLVQETPRVLTAQYHAAIERLVFLLHDETSTRSRRAAAWALANLRHPATMEHLVSALQDDDEQVQFGGVGGSRSSATSAPSSRSCATSDQARRRPARPTRSSRWRPSSCRRASRIPRRS